MSNDLDEWDILLLENPNQFLKKVNSLLSEEKSRLLGLKLLLEHVGKLPEEILSEIISGLVCNIHNIMSNGNVQIKKMSCRLISHLLKIANSTPNLSFSYSATHVNQLIILLTKSSNEWTIPALDCIFVTLKFYHNQCSHSKGQLEKFIFKCLSMDSEIAYVAAECFPWLSMIGGGGHLKVNYINLWKDNMKLLISSCHKCLNLLCDDLPGIEPTIAHCELSSKSIDLVALSSSPENKKAIVDEFKALSKCIVQMLRTKLPISVPVPHQSLLQIVIRNINICNFFIQKYSNKTFLQFIIPDLLTESMKLLQGLVVSLKTNLIPQANLINQMFVNSLKLSPNVENRRVFEKPFRLSRIQVYSALKTWLMVLNNGSGIHKESKEIFNEMKKDFTFTEDFVKLKATSRKDVGKRKNRGNLSFTLADQTGSNSYSKSFKKDPILCSSALQGLEALVNSAGNNIPSNEIREIYELITNIILRVQGSKVLTEPYSNWHCRMSLYSVLQACISTKNSKFSISLSSAMRLFLNGLQDKNYEVSSVCQRAVYCCELIIHPRLPTLDLATTNSRNRNSSNSNEQLFESKIDDIHDLSNLWTTKMPEQHTVTTIDDNIEPNEEQYPNVHNNYADSDHMIHVDSAEQEFLAKKPRLSTQNGFPSHERSAWHQSENTDKENDEMNEDLRLLPSNDGFIKDNQELGYQQIKNDTRDDHPQKLHELSSTVKNTVEREPYYKKASADEEMPESNAPLDEENLENIMSTFVDTSPD